MRILCALLLCLGWAQSSGAQALHPCDQVYAPNPATTPPFKVAFCTDSKDASGTVVVVTAFSVYLDGAKVFSGPLQPIGSPNATGFSYYEIPNLTTARGAHVITLTATDADGEGLPSAPLACTILGLVPSAPKVLTIKK